MMGTDLAHEAEKLLLQLHIHLAGGHNGNGGDSYMRYRTRLDLQRIVPLHSLFLALQRALCDLRTFPHLVPSLLTCLTTRRPVTRTDKTNARLAQPGRSGLLGVRAKRVLFRCYGSALSR